MDVAMPSPELPSRPFFLEANRVSREMLDNWWIITPDTPLPASSHQVQKFTFYPGEWMV